MESHIKEIRSMMDRKHYIRNISIIGHLNHGKTTIMTSLISASSIRPETGQPMDTPANESNMTVKSSGISLAFNMEDEKLSYFITGQPRHKSQYLVNLIDTPGHIDFSADVTAALRITDGAFVVVDCVEGIRCQTKMALRQALGERTRPLLIINKIDKYLLDRQVSGEEAYRRFKDLIDQFNQVVTTYPDPSVRKWKVSPCQGTVVFAAGLHGWGFKLKTFSKFISTKFAATPEVIMNKLWGNHFFDSRTREWSLKHNGSGSCQRAFVAFCYQPMRHILKASMADQKQELWRLLGKYDLNLKLKFEEMEKKGNKVMEPVMQTLLPAHYALLDTIICHIPSPHDAQAEWLKDLYPGAYDDYSPAIKYCDPTGPLMMYVVKMIQNPNHKSKFFALARLLSGTCSTGSRVRIMGPNYVPGRRGDLYKTKVEILAVWNGKNHLTIEDAPCGNIIVLGGLDKFITKTATLTTDDQTAARPIRPMRFPVFPVVSIAVQPLNPSELPVLVQGLKMLEKSDLLVVCSVKKTGEHIISGAGELHLDICLKDLVEEFMQDIEITKSSPFASFRETVLQPSSYTVMSRSPNRKNRLYMEARPLRDGLAEAIDEGRVGPKVDRETRVRILLDEFGWDEELATKIWCYGPNAIGPNVVVNTCIGERAQNLDEIKNAMVAAFQWASKKGALTGGRMQGIRFDVCDAVLHADANKRDGATEIIPTAKRVFHAAQLTAQPRLVEPIYLVEVLAPEMAVLEGIRSILQQKRGKVVEEIQRPGAGTLVRGLLPVAESLGLANDLRALYSSSPVKVFPQCVFDHWEVMSSDPLQADSVAGKYVAEIRARKGMGPLITPLHELEDWEWWSSLLRCNLFCSFLGGGL